jgi:hemin uptake protein HemP
MHPDGEQSGDFARPASADHDPSTALPQRVIESVDLLQGARQIQIRHNEQIYRLQVTRNGKLILVK